MNATVKSSYEHFRLRAGLSIVEVAARSGISVRDIAAAERGEYLFTPRELQSLSDVYQVTLATLLNTEPKRVSSNKPAYLVSGIVVGFSVLLILFGQLQIRSLIVSAPTLALASAARNVPAVADMRNPTGSDLRGASAHLHHQLIDLAIANPASAMPAMGGQDENAPDAQGNAAPLAAIASKRGALGAPYGCPIQPTAGQVVMTQGYNVGTHAPASAWGAVDLAVDSDGNGYSDPSATIGAPVVALHAGIARVVPNNWLAGNYVRLTDEMNGWATAYAHLKKLNITNGQRIEPGMIIGWVGTTGYSSGPHLHYEVYHNDININPLTVLECW